MKWISSLVALLFIASVSLGQGSLQYNQSLIIDHNQQTVPAGKVWKVTAVYGSASACVDVYSMAGGPYDGRPYTNALATFFDVNGNRVYSAIKHGSTVWYTNATCSSGSWTYSNSQQGEVVAPNPNALPVWLPAGTTLKGGANGIFLSVVEFNIVP